jgi:intracellular multiplication protein IcmK
MHHKILAICIIVLALVFVYTNVYSQNSTNRTKNKAFQKSINTRFPMSRQEIKKLRKRMEQTEKAVRGESSPEMTTRTRNLSFETGNKPPVLKIAPSYVTTVSFVDATGKPWPISSVTLGNPNYYNVVQPEGEGHIITVSALQEYADSNLSITFQDKNMPVTIQLKTESGKESTDSLVVFKTDKRGPNAETPAIGPSPESTIGNVMIAFLDRVPPSSAQRVEISPDVHGVSIWNYDNSLYVRTKHPVMWPAWTAVSQGSNDVSVYQMPEVSSLMVTRNGDSITIDLQGVRELVNGR